MDGESDDQTVTDQATVTKMKNAFIAQNVSSLQALGEFKCENVTLKRAAVECYCFKAI